MTAVRLALPPLRRTAGNLLAGSVTAAVFYAEYIGLGVVLAGALPGPGGAALGSALVVGAVLVNCLLGAIVRRTLLAGPRAASLAVLVAGMKLSSSRVMEAGDALPAAIAALFVMLLVAAGVQLAGLLPRVRAWLCCTSLALRKGFVFSTAVGIVVGAGSAQLDGCLRVSPVATCVVLAASVAAALGWSRWCRGGALRRMRSPCLAASLSSFSLLIGVGVACAGHHLLMARSAAAGSCGLIGGEGLEDAFFAWPGVSVAVLETAASSLPLWVWPALALLGGLLGLVLLLESLTALRESRDQTPPAEWAAQFKLRALANLASALFGLAPSSLAIARTNALVECGGRSRAAVALHGLALTVIVLFLCDWIAALPQLAVAAALLLLAVQMIDDDTREQVWRAGYSLHAVPADVRSAWTFWCVVAVSVVCGAALHYLGWGFGGGPLVALFGGTVWTARRFMQQRHALARSRHRAPTVSQQQKTPREGGIRY